MAEWLVEQGIGEDRAVLVEDGEIIAARLDWPGPLKAGLIENAVLKSRTAGSPRGTARFANGEEALVDKLPKDASEGAPIRLEVTRAALKERSRRKAALARPTERAVYAPTLAGSLNARIVRDIPGWEELWMEAFMRSPGFAGGRLEIDLTAGMTVIDIDGELPPRALSIAAVPAVARAIRRCDLAGSIVIDFPTLNAKADRQAVDFALAGALTGWPHERTAMNGFGLVQLVSRRERRSLSELLGMWPEAAARLLLRRAERVADPGALELSAPGPVHRALLHDWETELARRTGRTVIRRTDNTLPAWAVFAQAVPL